MKPLVHIGLAKAASTFLQFELFPNLDMISNLGKHPINKPAWPAISALTRQPSFVWRNRFSEYENAMRSAVTESYDAERRPVLSEEDLSVYKFLDPETMARRLRQLFGDYDVLLVTRDPVTWLQSQYLFRLQTLNSVAVFGFDEWLDKHFSAQRIGSDIAEIWFANLAETYSSVCGGALKIIPYELLKKDKDQFAALVAQSIGISTTEVRPYLDAPNEAEAHKIRITEDKRRAFETFRWIELRQPQQFVSSIHDLASDLKNPIPQPLTQRMTELLEIQRQEGDEHLPDRASWGSILQQIVQSWPNNAPAAKPVFPDFQLNKALSVARQQQSVLKESLGFDLLDFSVNYAK